MHREILSTELFHCIFLHATKTKHKTVIASVVQLRPLPNSIVLSQTWLESLTSGKPHNLQNCYLLAKCMFCITAYSRHTILNVKLKHEWTHWFGFIFAYLFR